MFMPGQTAILKKYYAQSKYITSELCQHLSRTLSLKEDAVRNWFSNQRAKEKRQQVQADQQNAATEGQ